MVRNFQRWSNGIVFQRLFLVSMLVLVGVLWIFGVALSAADTPSYEVYTVQDHETIATIAERYQVSEEALIRFNNLKSSDILHTGKTLLVPLIPQTSQPAANNAPPSDITLDISEDGDAAPDANQVKGYYATIMVDKAIFRTKPNGGDVLCDNWGKRKEVLVIGQTDTHYAVLMSDGSTGWVPRLALKVSDIEIVVERPETQKNYTPSNGHPEIVETAYEYMGIPYRLGGSLPNSVDCSLLVQTVFRRHGVSLPRTAAEQYKVGKPIDVSELLPGDRLYFYDPKFTKIGHTGIYVGGGRFIHASSNRKCVAVDDLSTPTYARKYVGACR